MAGEHRRSEREPVHPTFDFASIDAAAIDSASIDPASIESASIEAERLTDDRESTAECDAVQVPGEEPGADVRGFQARRSMSSSIGARRISSSDASSDVASDAPSDAPAKKDIAARLDAARQRLKRAVDVTGD